MYRLKIISISVLLSILVSTNIVAATTGGNLISNGGVENVSSSPLLPLGWNTNYWGVNSANFSYTSGSAGEGSRAITVNMTAYTSGDAKWYHASVPVTAGKTYTFSNMYKSNVNTALILEYKHNNGSLSYVNIAPNVPASSNWKSQSVSFTVPANIKSVTVYHTIGKVGSLSVDSYSLSANSDDDEDEDDDDDDAGVGTGYGPKKVLICVVTVKNGWIIKKENVWVKPSRVKALLKQHAKLGNCSEYHNTPTNNGNLSDTPKKNKVDYNTASVYYIYS